MLIDWFTVIAQIINFLILVWLLKRFLYKPILEAVNEREKKIADELNDAEMKKADAQKEKNEFQQKNNEFDIQRSDLLNKAKEEAKDERKKLLEQARKDAEALRSKFQESLQNEQQQLNDELIQRTQKQVIEVSRKLLSDIADSTLEENIVSVFLKKITSLSADEKNNLSKALGTSGKIIIQSTFPLTGEIKNRIIDALKKINGSAGDVLFEADAKQIGGIELIAAGYKLSWSIADYLDLIEKNAVLLAKDELRVPGKEEK
jgi:F-type H+-transporting ATPase subunit b